MSRVPMGSARRAGPGLPYGPTVRARFRDAIGDDGEFSQGLAAELIAKRWQLSRRELDEYGLRSHELAGRAQDSGRFAREIQTVASTGAHGGQLPVELDEGIRRGSTLETLAALTTPFRPDGRITAGNASQISDGAAAVLMASRSTAIRLGLRPLARFRAFALAGVEPVEMLTGPIPATRAVLAKAGLKVADVGVFEVNEAFASVVLAWQREIGADLPAINPNGGAIALGHPLGASGARLLTTMLHYMLATGVPLGVQVMCEGGGMANALVLELM